MFQELERHWWARILSAWISNFYSQPQVLRLVLYLVHIHMCYMWQSVTVFFLECTSNFNPLDRVYAWTCWVCKLRSQGWRMAKLSRNLRVHLAWAGYPWLHLGCFWRSQRRSNLCQHSARKSRSANFLVPNRTSCFSLFLLPLVLSNNVRYSDAFFLPLCELRSTACARVTDEIKFWTLFCPLIAVFFSKLVQAFRRAPPVFL